MVVPLQGCWHTVFPVAAGVEWPLNLLFSRQFQIPQLMCQKKKKKANLSMGLPFLSDARMAVGGWIDRQT